MLQIMACKQKLEVEDFEAVTEPVDTTSVHRVLSEV